MRIVRTFLICLAFVSVLCTGCAGKKTENIAERANVTRMHHEADQPPYLENPEVFQNFWQQVQAGQDGQFYIVEPGEPETYLRFTFTDGTGEYAWARDMDGPLNWERHPIQDWTVSERGNFYFRTLPTVDKHVIHYTQIRTVPVDPECWRLTQQYIAPVGYSMVNLFLEDWNEDNFGNLSFNDFWEAAYRIQFGKSYEPDVSQWDGPCCWLPAAEFEDVICGFFKIQPDALRECAGYDQEKNGYPWYPVSLFMDSFGFLRTPALIPEVVTVETGKNGTSVLTVEVGSSAMKTDRLFSHQVTLRFLEGGGVQYVGNRILSQTGWGLPDATPRSVQFHAVTNTN